MTTIEFELERVIEAPVGDVFARLVDIEGYNAWMPQKGSMLRRTRQTSPGEPAVGTTYVDETSQGPIPGEIVECDAPRALVFHWWEKVKSQGVVYELILLVQAVRAWRMGWSVASSVVLVGWDLARTSSPR